MVVTTKSTIVVNAAFLQEIKDSNPEFYKTIDRLRSVCETDDSPARLCRNLTRLLDQLREQIALQFSLEESYGYMLVPSHSDDFLGETAVEVQAHHGMLYMHLSDLAEQAEELQYRGVEPRQLRVLVESACEFEFRLREHERAENELIERSFRLF
ncbi:MAG: hypothetical protein P8L85_06515 [Rubripirellula sp.]|nr:hypothetical protein [Rubripirellula sp.]